MDLTKIQALSNGAQFYSELSDMTGLRTFVGALAGHVAAQALRK